MRKSATVPRTQEWLNGTERSRLRILETTIERGARMFVEMGKALAEIRDTRLYRESHSTFERYCRERWTLSRSRAYQFIDAAGIAEKLSTNVDTPQPASEAVSRELAAAGDDDAIRETWAKAVELHGPQPTAAQVREIRQPSAESGDTRFELVEDAVALLKLLPEPDQIAFPSDPGDVEVLDDALAWLSKWLPEMKAAWREHRRQSRSVASVA